jgi:hypothetical protein
MRIFISYSSTDRDWAQKLAVSLQRQGHDVFFDKDSLRAGDNWETQILGSLQDCDHLIVLWSKNAKDSPWVQRELGHFDGKRYKGRQRLQGHLLLHVLLDDTVFAYSSDQSITALRDARAYASPVENLRASVWDSAMAQVNNALGDSSLPVTLAVLTLTRQHITCEGVPAGRCVDFEFVPPAGRSLNQLLDAIGLSRAQLTTFYHDRREDWRPFGGSQSIGNILDELKSQLNSVPGNTPIRWVSIDDELLSDDRDRLVTASHQLAAGLSLVVFDPVALYSQWIRGLLQYLDGCLNNPHAIIAVLPIVATPPEPRTTHTNMIRQVFARLVDQFYEELPVIEHAQCSIFTADNADIRRMVRGTLRELSSEPRQGPATAFLGMRRRG